MSIGAKFHSANIESKRRSRGSNSHRVDSGSNLFTDEMSGARFSDSEEHSQAENDWWRDEDWTESSFNQRENQEDHFSPVGRLIDYDSGSGCDCDDHSNPGGHQPGHGGHQPGHGGHQPGHGGHQPGHGGHQPGHGGHQPGPIGPGPIPPIGPTGPTGGQSGASGSSGPTGSTGGQSGFTGSTGGQSGPTGIANQAPYSCMIELMNRYCTGGLPLTEDQKKAAYSAFIQTTGYQPVDLTAVTDNIANQGTNLANFNSFYMFMPMIILLLVFIWLLVGFHRINWVVGLFATVFVIVILYSFSIAYRLNVEIYTRNRATALNEKLTASQANFQDSIAYWNQGLFASACAITCRDGINCWNCNRSDLQMSSDSGICPNGDCGQIEANSEPEILALPRQPRKKSSRRQNIAD